MKLLAVVTPPSIYHILWTEYTDFDNKIGSFDADGFIWKSKYISDGNSYLWHKKYPLPFTKVIGIGAADIS